MTTPPDGPHQPASPGDPAGAGWQPQWQPQYNPQGGYAPSPPPGYGYAVPDHPKAQTSLVLGILGLVLCQVIAPFAWSTGKKTVNEIDASGGRLGGRSQAQTGYVLGIVGSVILIAGAGLMVVYLVFMVLVFGVAASGSS